MKHIYTGNVLAVAQLLLLVILTPLSAQQNGGFENWSPSGSPPPFDWKFPTGWTTTNATTEFISAGVRRVTDVHSGTYAAEIRTLNVFGTNRRSQLALGVCKLNYPEYRIEPYTGGEAMASIPQEVSFYYKLSNLDTTDVASVEVMIKRPPGLAFEDLVFYARTDLQPAGAYTRMTIPIGESGIDIATDSILIVFSSNGPDAPGSNILVVDDVVIDFTSSNHPGPSDGSMAKVYPNPIRSSGTLTIVNPEKEIHEAHMIDATGRIVSGCLQLAGDDENVELTGLPPASGIYSLLLDGKYLTKIVVVD